MAAVNTSKVRDPKWTGADGEVAVLVSRGEPNRSDLQMEQAVADQARRYLDGFAKDVAVSEVAIALAVQLIAKDYITPRGSRQVVLGREHLLAFVEVAQQRLGELAADHAQD